MRQNGVLTSTADVATILGTAILVWGIIARMLRRSRERLHLAWTNGELQTVAVLAGLLAGAVCTIVLSTLTNHTLAVHDANLTNIVIVNQNVIIRHQLQIISYLQQLIHRS